MDNTKNHNDSSEPDPFKPSEDPTNLDFDSHPAYELPSHAWDTTKKPNKIAGLFKNKKMMVIAGTALVLVAATATFVLTNDPSKTAVQTQSQQQPVKKLGVAVGLTDGLVQYSDDATSWQDITDDTELSEGDSIRTATDGRVVLLIDDGSAVRLDSSSEVKLTRLNADSIVITNTAGEVYSRVVASETREYSVAVGEENYKAKGTAYRTFNEETKKGVEVFHSAVEAITDKKEVPEGNYLYSKHEQADKQGTVMALDLEALKADEFIKWNSEQDKLVANYANKLGVLEELDKPVVTPVPTAAPTPKPATAAASGITLTGKQSDYSAVFSWKSSGIDTSKGYKLVRSSKTTSPTYPDNSVTFIEAGKTSYTLYVGEDTAYHYRICAYREKACESYSNTVTVATAKKVKETVQPGPVSASLSGNVVSWSIGGTAPYGYKVVVGTSPNPSYGDNYKKYFTESTSYELPGYDFTPGTSYYIKVCKYNDGCTDYSNEVVYTP